MDTRDKLRAWARERNECDESAIHRIDAEHARRLGLAVLAELTRLRADLEDARGPMLGREVVAHLTPIIQLVRGEAQDYLRNESGDETLEVPGIVAYARKPE